MNTLKKEHFEWLLKCLNGINESLCNIETKTLYNVDFENEIDSEYPVSLRDYRWKLMLPDHIKNEYEKIWEKITKLSNCIDSAKYELEKEIESKNSSPKKKLTKLDELLLFIHKNPGCLRRDMQKNVNISENTLNVYLSSYYGYKETTPGRYRRKSKNNNLEYFYSKIVNGKNFYAYYLNNRGKKRVQSLLNS